jgi:hypothetical protein
MKRNKLAVLALMLGLVFLISACERNNTVCPPELEAEKPTLKLADLLVITPEPGQNLLDVEVQIGRKLVLVDKLVSGPVCNDDWSGTVYVGCDAQVAEAELDADANPLFFEGCNLNIASNTLVYVAAHNNEAFYKGCSCHTGGDPIP